MEEYDDQPRRRLSILDPLIFGVTILLERHGAAKKPNWEFGLPASHWKDVSLAPPSVIALSAPIPLPMDLSMPGGREGTKSPTLFDAMHQDICCYKEMVDLCS